MKKTVKRMLWILVPIIVLAGLGFYYLHPMLSMNPAQTGLVPKSEIYAIQSNQNAIYFVPTEGGYIMVDAGSDIGEIEAALGQTAIHVDEVKWILLTHSDSDHVAALLLFPAADIYMGADELGLLNGTVKRSAFGGNRLPSGVSVDAVHLLEDGQTLSLGGMPVACIAAPGHTPGSMAYAVNERYLFTGDAFQVTDSRIDVHPYSMDARRSRETIETLKETASGDFLVLTAHYGYWESTQLD